MRLYDLNFFNFRNISNQLFFSRFFLDVAGGMAEYDSPFDTLATLAEVGVPGFSRKGVSGFSRKGVLRFSRKGDRRFSGGGAFMGFLGESFQGFQGGAFQGFLERAFLGLLGGALLSFQREAFEGFLGGAFQGFEGLESEMDGHGNRAVPEVAGSHSSRL